MKLNIFLKGFVCTVVLLFSTYSWALYPEKQGYIPEKYNIGVYVGVGIGTTASNTFNLATHEDYISLYAPTRMLSSGVSLANMGIRLFDFRFEGEYSNFYQWYSIFNDARYHTTVINANNLPKKGQEAFTGFAFNAYYDLRFISNTFYPYIGAGVGSSRARFVAIDVKTQPNGLGEEYSAHKTIGFYQLMAGLQYDLKVVKSSFSMEYRLMKSDKMHVYPDNDGLYEIADGKKPGEAESMYPNAEDWHKPEARRVSPIFHSVIFTYRYYLY